jgi:hypothetical protein
LLKSLAPAETVGAVKNNGRMTTTPRFISAEERRARLGVRHRLAPSARAETVEAVVESLVALHATDAATVYLSALARLATPSATAVEQALYADRTLARMHGMRQTLFVFPAALAPAIQASTTRELWAKERASLLKSAAAAGLAADWLDGVEAQTLAALAAGTATGAELSKAVPALKDQVLYGKGTANEAWQTATARVLRVLGFAGRIVRDRPVGSWTSSQFRWALAVEHEDLPVAEAQAAVLRCWLAAFGPGTEADLKWWTGWRVTEVRKALAAVGAVEVRVDSGAAWVLSGDEEPGGRSAEPWAALLPGLDPTPMGWQVRDWYLADSHRAALFDRSGNVGPTVWWNGEVVGGWAQRGDGSVVTRLFSDVGSEAAQAVAAEAERWRGVLGEIRVTPRFRTPLERELVS